MNIPRKLKKRFKQNISTAKYNIKDNSFYKQEIFNNIIIVKTCLNIGYSRALNWLIENYPNNKQLLEFKIRNYGK